MSPVLVDNFLKDRKMWIRSLEIREETLLDPFNRICGSRPAWRFFFRRLVSFSLADCRRYRYALAVARIVLSTRNL